MLVDIGPDGRRSDPRFIVIEATQLDEVRVQSSIVTIEQLKVQVSDDASLRRVVVEPSATADATGALDRVIRALPNVTNVVWEEPTVDGAAEAQGAEMKESVRETVLDYLRHQPLANESLRSDLLLLAERFLDQGGHR